ncbi:MAG: hypothetical protein ACYDA3_04750 [Gaiellaceae bacterium]
MALVRLTNHEQELTAFAASSKPTPKRIAASPTAGPDLSYVVAGYALIGIGWVVAWLVWKWRAPVGFSTPAGVTVFGPLYIFAQAIERILEPFSKFLGAAKDSSGAKTTKGTATFKVEDAIANGDAQTAANWQTIVEQIRRNTTVITWSAATVLGTLASGTFGVFLVRSLGYTGMPAQVDMIITGLAIGSGTKPLHDFISNLQASKDSKQTPAEAGGDA